MTDPIRARIAADDDVLDLALAALGDTRDPVGLTLLRPGLLALSAAGQGRLLQHWLARHTGRGLESQPLDILLARLAPERGPGLLKLADRWQLVWERTTLKLIRAVEGHG